MDAQKNFARVTVSTTYDDNDVSIVLEAGEGAKLPTVPFNATWWNSTDYPDPSKDPNVEIVRVTAIVSDTLTVTRGQEGITATTKNEAAKTYEMVAGFTLLTYNEISAALPTKGAGPPGGSVAGYFYVDETNRDIWVKISGTWEILSDLL